MSLPARAPLVLLSLASFVILAQAPAPTNCPSAFRPFSTNTPLMDILQSPEASSVVNRDLPGFLDRLPPMLRGVKPPNLSNVLTIHVIASEFMPIPPGTIDKLDKDLAAVPVTQEVAAARCARYDQVPPSLPANLAHPALLVFSKSNGFRDGPSVDAGKAAIKDIGDRRHWHLFFTDNAAVFNSKDLAHFDAVIWNNVSGDVLTVPQRGDFKAYIEKGGGFVGVHGSGGDPYCDWDWYADTLIGARFKGHPMSPQFQAAKVHIDDPKDAIVHGLPDSWTMTDEWYSFRSNPRAKGAHILATLDESTYHPETERMKLSMGGDHPIAWTQCIDNGRSFYMAIGHRPEGYTEPNVNKLLEQGIAWASGLGATACQSGREVARP